MKTSLIKSSREIILIEKACELTDKTFRYILKQLKVRVTEKQISLEIQRFIRKNNAKLAFRPIVAFGKNSSEPHHVPTNNQLTNNQIILLDLGAKVNGYCSDMTRTVFMGNASSKQKRMYQTVLEAQKLAIAYLTQRCHSELVSESQTKIRSRNKFGMTGKEIDKVARDYIISQGFPTIPHTLGHGIGKKVHEGFRLGPKSKTILRNGMVFTIEPGIYIPNFGGVRIEDVFYLNKGKLKQLTHSPKNILVLQNFTP